MTTTIRYTNIFQFLFSSLLLLTLFVSCQKESPEIKSSTDTSFLEFEEGGAISSRAGNNLQDDILAALHYMNSELGYGIPELQDINDTIILCQGVDTCLENRLTAQQYGDFTFALREIALPSITLDLSDNSVWQADYQADSAFLRLDHNSRQLSIEIDMDNGVDDKKAIGIIAIINGQRFAVDQGNRETNLLRPTEDGGRVDRLNVRLAGDTIHYHSEGGTYNGLKPGTGDFDTVFMTAAVLIVDDFLQCELDGIYYILPPKTDVSVSVDYKAGIQNVTVSQDDYFRVYKPETERVFLDAPFAATMRVLTFAENLQLDAVLGAKNFELDFDHCYKDSLQKSVVTTFIVEEVVQ